MNRKIYRKIARENKTTVKAVKSDIQRRPTTDY